MRGFHRVERILECLATLDMLWVCIKPLLSPRPIYCASTYFA